MSVAVWIRTFHFRSHSVQRWAWANLPVKVPVPLQLSASTLVSSSKTASRSKRSRKSFKSFLKKRSTLCWRSTNALHKDFSSHFCWRMQTELPTFVVERSPLARLQHSIGRRLLRSLCALQRLGSSWSIAVGKLVTRPFRAWQKMSEKFAEHQSTKYHQACMELADDLKRRIEHSQQALPVLLDQRRAENIEKTEQSLSHWREPFFSVEDSLAVGLHNSGDLVWVWEKCKRTASAPQLHESNNGEGAAVQSRVAAYPLRPQNQPGFGSGYFCKAAPPATGTSLHHYLCWQRVNTTFPLHWEVCMAGHSWNFSFSSSSPPHTLCFSLFYRFSILIAKSFGFHFRCTYRCSFCLTLWALFFL